MTTVTTVRSWPAIGLGAFFAGVTGYVLFKDVLDGASINTGHVLTLAALVAAIAAGHMALPALRKVATAIPGLGLLIVALAATAYITVTSGARNAEQSGNKTRAIAASNTAREAELKLKGEAETMLADAQRKLAKECGTGDGTRCKGVQKTIDVYQAAIRGHDAKLEKLAPPKVANGYAHAARVLQSWGASVTVEWLELNMDFVVVLITEFSTVWFLHLGLGHGPSLRLQVPTRHPARGAMISETAQTSFPVSQPLPAPALFSAPLPDDDPTPPRGSRRRSLQAAREAKVRSFSAAFIARHGRHPSSREIASGCRLPSTTAWRIQAKVAA